MWPFAPKDDGFFTAEQAAGDYDYIIVGGKFQGGTAGCTLARRLSEDGLSKVLLIERGNAAENFASRNPTFSQNWAFGWAQSFRETAVPSSNVEGREVEIVGGRALGGASRTNGLMYARGVAGEFNEWSADGRKGWSYDEIEPFFKKSQNCLDPFVEDYQGHDGPWTTKRHQNLFFPSSQKTVDAAIKLGIPAVTDANSPDVSAVGITHIHQIITADGKRNSNYHAFLPLSYSETRKNLTICTNTLARKLDVSTVNGQVRASGVFFQAIGGHTVYHAKAHKEVILACGALFSPQLLMLSGIGPEDHLTKIGIPVQKNLPGVGSSLQDHMGIFVEYQIPANDSWAGLMLKPWRFLYALIIYIIWGTGAFTVPQVEVATFMQSSLIDKEGNLDHPEKKLDSRDPANCPDFEIMTIPNGDPRRPGFDSSKGCLNFAISILRPQSTGTLRLKSSDPSEFPLVDLNYMSNEQDYTISRSALRLVMRLAREIEKTGYYIRPYSEPSSFEDADLDAFVRRTGLSVFHYCSSCRMAPENEFPRAGVVDDELRVHGVEGLRIADASVFPKAPSAHPMAPVTMVAEKCADMILSARVI